MEAKLYSKVLVRDLNECRGFLYIEVVIREVPLYAMGCYDPTNGVAISAF